jgi:PAS domain S-box-containing protein
MKPSAPPNAAASAGRLFLAAAAVWVVSIGAMYWAGRVALRSQRTLVEQRTGVEQLAGVLSVLQDAETGQRGYLMTGEAGYLEPYHDAVRRLNSALDGLGRMAAKRELPEESVTQVLGLTAKKMAELEETIKLRREAGLEAALKVVRTGAGKQWMDQIRSQITGMMSREEAAYQEALRTTARTVWLRSGVFIALGLLNLGFLWWAYRQIVREIAERQRAEEKVRLQAAALESAANAIVITGRDGAIQWANQAFTRLTGYTAAEAMGQNPRLLKSGKSEPALFKELWGTILAGRVWHGEVVNKRKNGTFYTEEMTITPLSDARGEAARFIAIKQDITARKRAEEAQARLAAIVEGSEDAILSKSLDGKIQTWNAGAERMFGYRPEEVIGQLVTLLLPAERIEEEDRMLERLSRGESIEHFETVQVTKAGRRLDVSLTISPVKDKQGRVVGASSIVRDIGELMRAREVLARSRGDLERLVEERTAKLQEALADLEHMSYSMIHDMRAPLRAMQTFATLVEEECATWLPPQGLDYFRRIREAASRLDRLVTGALNYNQVVRHDLAVAPVEVGTLMRGIIATYPDMQPPAADISIEFSELVVLGNESLLTQCLGNLLENAVKFVAPGVKPHIRVWAESVRSPEPKVQSQPTEESAAGHAPPVLHSLSSGTLRTADSTAEGGRTTQHTTDTTPALQHSTTPLPLVRLWVEDNGIGIPKEAHQKIFSMFQRMHHESEYPGTGIGLAIVRKAVERMGGRVGLESEPGKGSQFWIELSETAGAAATDEMESAA